MGEVALLLVPWFGIRVVGRRRAGLMLGLILILQLYLALLVSWVGPGYRSMDVVLLVLILLPGLAVLAFSANLLLSFELCIGRRALRIWVILVFPLWNF